jgi:hypothetical protein
MPTTPAVSLPSVPRIAAPLASRALTWYYLVGTPLFFVADLTLGISVRAAFFDGQPMLRFLYYAVAFGCGVAAVKLPAWSGLLGLVESGANIVLLVFGVMLGYFQTLDAAIADRPMLSPFGGTSVVNLVLSGAMLSVAYMGHQAAIGRSSRDR